MSGFGLKQVYIWTIGYDLALRILFRRSYTFGIDSGKFVALPSQMSEIGCAKS